jgi:lipopolysaccharide/colanic/teichoic acid biosynthesis glycosyltransferase
MATKSEKERLAVVETKIDNMAKDIAEIKTAVLANAKANDQKYAAKWVQQVVGGFIGLVLVAVVTALLALVIKGAK